jgi:hypothetical protein
MRLSIEKKFIGDGNQGKIKNYFHKEVNYLHIEFYNYHLQKIRRFAKFLIWCQKFFIVYTLDLLRNNLYCRSILIYKKVKFYRSISIYGINCLNLQQVYYNFYLIYDADLRRKLFPQVIINLTFNFRSIAKIK